MNLHRYQLDVEEVDGARRYSVAPGSLPSEAIPVPSMMPSVTTVLAETKPERDRRGLERWRHQVGEAEAERVRQEAATRGTALHTEIEAQLTDPFLAPHDLPADASPWLQSLRVVLRHCEAPVLIEAPVWHPTAHYAGTVDVLARWRDGALTVVDWKTARKPKKLEWCRDYELQVAAYTVALRSLYHPRLDDLRRGCIAIAMEDRPAVVFHLDEQRMRGAWHEFSMRLAQWRLTHAAT